MLWWHWWSRFFYSLNILLDITRIKRVYLDFIKANGIFIMTFVRGWGLPRGTGRHAAPDSGSFNNMHFKWNNGTSPVTSVPETTRDPSFDDVIVFVLVFVSALVIIFIVCSIYKLKLWYRGQHDGTGAATGGPNQAYADDPPPYPGKLSRTNINYLPSYNSALQMSSLSGGLTDETSNRPESIRKDQNETYLTVPSLAANGSQLGIPETEEPRTSSPVSQESRQLQSITEENAPRLPVIQISDASSESPSPAVFTLWCAAHFWKKWEK